MLVVKRMSARSLRESNSWAHQENEAPYPSHTPQVTCGLIVVVEVMGVESSLSEMLSM
ncbi:MAG: hypothetical protein ACI9TH_005245 [Kiritimatiellia bacterium]|jgi:hypothetical protein